MVDIDLCRLDLLELVGRPGRTAREVPRRRSSVPQKGSGLNVCVYPGGDPCAPPVVFHDVNSLAASLTRSGVRFDLGDIALLNKGGTFHCCWWPSMKRLCVYGNYLDMYNAHSACGSDLPF